MRVLESVNKYYLLKMGTWLAWTFADTVFTLQTTLVLPSEMKTEDISFLWVIEICADIVFTLQTTLILPSEMKTEDTAKSS